MRGQRQPMLRPRAALNMRAMASATMEASSSGRPAQQQNPRKVAIFVEPSPFSHISGMKNRFESLIRGLRDEGDEVMVITPDPTPPKEFCGAKVWR